MNTRQILERHLQTLDALKSGGIRQGFGNQQRENPLQQKLRAQWQTQHQLTRRVLSEPGDPTDVLLMWRERTEGFMSRFPARQGWTDRAGQKWVAQDVLGAIDKLMEEIELGMMEDEEFEFEEEDEEELYNS